MHPGANPRIQLDAVVFRPPRALGVISGGAIAAWALVLAVFAISVAWGAEAGPRTFLAWAVAAVLSILGILFASWAYSVSTMAYTIGRDSLVITWGFRRILVPLDTVQRMIPGRTIDQPSVEGLNWWGCHVGVADVRRIGFTLFYSTHSSPEDILYVVTGAEAYALTVPDQAAFAEAIQERAALGAVEPGFHRAVATGFAALPFWRDRVAIIAAIAAGIATCITAGYVYVSYPGLPDVVQLNYPDLGGIVRIGDKSELLRIAYAAVGMTVANVILGVLVHARERAAGLWLLASSVLLQGVLLAAAVAAFERA